MNDINKIKSVIEKMGDGDALLVVHFSKAADKYQGYQINLDAGDALLVIKGLIQTYGLLPEAVLEATR